MRDTLLADRGVALMRTVQRLPALLDLDIDNYEGLDWSILRAARSIGNGLPACEELAQLHSRSLTRLRVSMLDARDEDDVLRLSALPELRSCQLLGSETLGGYIQLNPASFQGAPRLQHLYLDSIWALDLQDGSLAPLNALTSLTMTNCAIKKVPTDVASFADTLCELDLGGNEDLQLDSAAAARIVQCSRLRTLGLRKPDISAWGEHICGGWESFEEHMDDVGYTPSLWSPESTRQLVLLPSAFHMRHGRYLQIIC